MKKSHHNTVFGNKQRYIVYICITVTELIIWNEEHSKVM